MALKNSDMDIYHFTFTDGTWKLKKDKSMRSIKIFETKEEGVDFTTKFMKQNGGTLKIHKANDSFQEERTYPKSKDPKSSKG